MLSVIYDVTTVLLFSEQNTTTKSKLKITPQETPKLFEYIHPVQLEFEENIILSPQLSESQLELTRDEITIKTEYKFTTSLYTQFRSLLTNASIQPIGDNQHIVFKPPDKHFIKYKNDSIREQPLTKQSTLHNTLLSLCDFLRKTTVTSQFQLPVSEYKFIVITTAEEENFFIQLSTTESFESTTCFNSHSI